MYRKASSRPEDPDAFARGLIREHPFGVIVAGTPPEGDGTLMGSHIPFLLVSGEGEPIRLAGHLARANELWRRLEGAHEVLAIFSGPHAYISSSWYERDDVATWNYAAVHVHATARLMDADEARAHVVAVTKRFEGERGLMVSEASLDKHTPAIVAFELTAHRVDCALKMSQSKADDEYARVLGGLDGRGCPADTEVARVMRGLRPG